ncbi:Modification methylase DpnIIA [Oligella sp. MSHR50489EDL]|uniref:DNA adenine methylase n=1 Tax=Oligella sp. MSHR50489EDL TaxID=3139409 RepID=UPI003D8186D1
MAVRELGQNRMLMPFLKWAGGKRQLLAEICRLLPDDYARHTHIEPFIGGGSVLFHLQPERAVINDVNDELINAYLVIKNHPEALIKDLKKHKNNAEYFYAIRALDRSESFTDLSPIERASRLIYLNKTCFNGLYRVNKAGYFNAPFGRYKNPNIINEAVIRAVSHFLNTRQITISCGHYADTLKNIDQNAFVYFDPPYHPVSRSANFTGYVKGGFDENDQIALKAVCDELHKKGIKFLLSNSATEFILDLYSDYDVHIVQARRAINSKALKRGGVEEVLVRNY